MKSFAQVNKDCKGATIKNEENLRSTDTLIWLACSCLTRIRHMDTPTLVGHISDTC